MTRVAMILAIALAFLSQTARAEDMKPDGKGFIRNWLLLAPIAVANDEGGGELDKQQIPDEAKLAPKEGDKVKVSDKELVWKKIQAKEFYFDINELLGGQNDNVVCYAVCYVTAEEEMKGLEMGVSSNDQAKVYMNGKEVFRFDGTRQLEEGQDVVNEMTLKKGVNTIIFKIQNCENNWQGALRFMKGDAPVKNLKVSLTK